MQAILGLLHGTDYLVTHLLLGSVLFYEFILPAGGNDAVALENRKSRNLRILAFFALLTSLLWMILSVNDMSESWAPSELWAGMSGTAFGHFWCLRIGVLLGIVLSVKRALTTPVARSILLLMALSLPLFSTLTGHAGAQPDRVFLRETLALFHSVAVAVWTGGLFRLYCWLGLRLRQKSARPEMSHSVVHRFSHFAMASTGIIALTGVIMAYLAGISLLRPFATDYGKLVSAKIVLFGFALGAAAINQFVHLRKWEPTREREFAVAIHREVGLESLIVVCVFGVAGFLARTSM